MNKIISLTIASTFIFSLLSACTNNTVTQETSKVTTQNVTSSITTLSLEDALSAVSAAQAEKHEVQVAVDTTMANAGLICSPKSVPSGVRLLWDNHTLRGGLFNEKLTVQSRAGSLRDEAS